MLTANGNSSVLLITAIFYSVLTLREALFESQLNAWLVQCTIITLYYCYCYLLLLLYYYYTTTQYSMQ